MRRPLYAYEGRWSAVGLARRTTPGPTAGLTRVVLLLQLTANISVAPRAALTPPVSSHLSPLWRFARNVYAFHYGALLCDAVLCYRLLLPAAVALWKRKMRAMRSGGDVQCVMMSVRPKAQERDRDRESLVDRGREGEEAGSTRFVLVDGGCLVGGRGEDGWPGAEVALELVDLESVCAGRRLTARTGARWGGRARGAHVDARGPGVRHWCGGVGRGRDRDATRRRPGSGRGRGGLGRAWLRHRRGAHEAGRDGSAAAAARDGRAARVLALEERGRGGCGQLWDLEVKGVGGREGLLDARAGGHGVGGGCGGGG